MKRRMLIVLNKDHLFSDLSLQTRASFVVILSIVTIKRNGILLSYPLKQGFMYIMLPPLHYHNHNLPKLLPHLISLFPPPPPPSSNPFLLLLTIYLTLSIFDGNLSNQGSTIRGRLYRNDFITSGKDIRIWG